MSLKQQALRPKESFPFILQHVQFNYLTAIKAQCFTKYLFKILFLFIEIQLKASFADLWLSRTKSMNYRGQKTPDIRISKKVKTNRDFLNISSFTYCPDWMTTTRLDNIEYSLPYLLEERERPGSIWPTSNFSLNCWPLHDVIVVSEPNYKQK